MYQPCRAYLIHNIPGLGLAHGTHGRREIFDNLGLLVGRPKVVDLVHKRQRSAPKPTSRGYNAYLPTIQNAVDVLQKPLLQDLVLREEEGDLLALDARLSHDDLEMLLEIGIPKVPDNSRAISS